MTAGVVLAPLIMADTGLHTRSSRSHIDTDTPVFMQSGRWWWRPQTCTLLRGVFFCRYSWSADLLHSGWIQAGEGPVSSPKQEVQQTRPTAFRPGDCQSRRHHQVKATPPAAAPAGLHAGPLSAAMAEKAPSSPKRLWFTMETPGRRTSFRPTSR